MAELTQDIIDRLEYLESEFRKHLGTQAGATTINQPHTGVPYLNSSHQVPVTFLPTGTTSSDVAAGNHGHAYGYYL